MDNKTRKILNEYLQIVKLLKGRCTFESCSCEFKGPYNKVDKARHEGEMALAGEIVGVITEEYLKEEGVKNG